MNGYKLYSRINDHETILELWGGSTKHPDSIFYFSNFHLSEWFEPEDQIIPWLFECASKLNFPCHAYSLAKWACNAYEEIEISGQAHQLRPKSPGREFFLKKY